MKHLNVIAVDTMNKNHATGCNECQASCQSACKTSCTVGNQSCAHEESSLNKKGGEEFSR